MTPHLNRLLLVVAVLLVLAGGVVAWAASTGPGRDPAPPAATRDVPGVVSIARPVKPVTVSSVPPGVIELRITEPDGGQTSVMTFRETRTRSRRRVDRRCLMAGPEAQLRRVRQAFGNCREEAVGSEPWAIITGASSEGSVTLNGIAAKRVARLTVAGPGGTFRLPVSPGGAFMVVYGKKASGRAVLTATLTDGTTRFFRTELLPSFRPPGAVVVPDPGGLPPWTTGAGLRTSGVRKGQTCVQVSQDRRLRARGPKAGGAFLAPACGDLTRNAVFARTVVIGPTKTLGTFGGGPDIPRRTVLAGAASKNVRDVTLLTPQGPRKLELADAGRAFLAVFPASTAPSPLTLEITLNDGTRRRFENPVAVNRATTENPPPRLRGRITLRLDPPGSRRVVLQARLSTNARRAQITFLGREVRLRRIGQGLSYKGVYDGERGARRPLRPGAIQRFSLLLCGDVCSTELRRARLR